MSAMAKFFYQISGSSGASSLAAQLPSMLPIFMGDSFPLEQHTALPGSDKGGELILGLQNLSAGPMRIQALRPGPQENELTVELANFTLHGRYEIYGLEQSKNTIDTGGNFAPLAHSNAGGKEQTDSDPPPLTTKQYDYLVRADQQRTDLLKMSNGQTLINTYNDNSDIYTYVFNNDATLRGYWAEDNRTSQMMDYTYTALDPLNKYKVNVNPEKNQKVFGDKKPLTYNDNAFAQQLYVAGACENFSQNGNDEYDKAAIATYDFGNRVTHDTSNSQSVIKPMTAGAVFQTIYTASSDSTSRAHAITIRDAVKQLVSGKETTQSRKVLAEYGYNITDEVLEKLRTIHQPRPERRRIALWHDYLNTPIAGCSLVYRLTEQPNSAITAKLRKSTLRIPSLDLNTSSWTGPSAQLAIERVQNAHFLLSMLEDRVRSGVTRHIRRIGGAMARGDKKM